MYIRVKSVKGYEYAYLVENKWKKRGKNKGARQRVKKYLGRVFPYERKHDDDFFDFMGVPADEYMGERDYEQVLRDLIKWEFYRHDIEDGILVYHNKGKVQKEDKNVCLRLNEGFLCGFTLKKLFRFDGKGSEPEVGKRLARALVDSGIGVPAPVFIGLFEKVFEGINTPSMRESGAIA